MNILLCNDDGIDAIGIRTLINALAPCHRVCVVAPAVQQSAVSKALTLYSPLRAERRLLPDHPEIEAYAVMGTPVDCIRLGLGNLIKEGPDMVISGINIGPNLGTDTLYSGTCAAAQEASLYGLNSIALSCRSFNPKHMETSAMIGLRMAAYAAGRPLPFGAYYNVNVPDLPYESLLGIKLTQLGILRYEDEYIRRTDTIGRDYYWAPRQKLSELDGADTDERWIAEGYVTVTPLSYNNEVCGLDVEGLDEVIA
ncbi:MAG: 5'/3'-nucleotidase SurE [Clostridia bacterium]|nr:5'/3'-nucleotidase SurE [Clostridia bacterium]